MRRTLAMLLAPAVLLLAACGSGSSSSTTSGATGGSGSGQLALSTKNISGLGPVLVNGQGRTLYVFAPDKGKSVTCNPACEKVWPPLKISSGQKPTLSGGVKSSLVSSVSDPSGGSVVTYKGWPLYLYVADPTPGTASGQALNSSGGLWYVISPSGTVIKKPAPSSNGGTNGY